MKGSTDDDDDDDHDDDDDGQQLIDRGRRPIREPRHTTTRPPNLITWHARNQTVKSADGDRLIGQPKVKSISLGFTRG